MLNDCSKLSAYLGISSHKGGFDTKRDEKIGSRNMKGFNTDTIAVRSKVGSRCLSGEVYKDSINFKRINAETLRQQLASASYISVPVLKMKDGTHRIPRKYQAAHLRKHNK